MTRINRATVRPLKSKTNFFYEEFIKTGLGINIRHWFLVENSIIADWPHSVIRMLMCPYCHINLVIIPPNNLYLIFDILKLNLIFFLIGNVSFEILEI